MAMAPYIPNCQLPADKRQRIRLDSHNGLLLTWHIDHLFDQGYISFTDNGEILLSGSLSHKVAQVFCSLQADSPTARKPTWRTTERRSSSIISSG